MMKRYEDERLRGWLNRLKRLFKRNPEAPEDPQLLRDGPEETQTANSQCRCRRRVA